MVNRGEDLSGGRGFDSHRGQKIFLLPCVVPCFPLLGLAPSALFMGLSSTLIYTSGLILCSIIRVLGSLGRWLLMTSTQEPNTMAPQSALCICSRKWKAKLIVPIYFGTKTSEFCLRIISFSSLESELSFDSKDSKINFDRARLTTVKSLLGALRAL